MKKGGGRLHWNKNETISSPHKHIDTPHFVPYLIKKTIRHHKIESANEHETHIKT